MKAIILAAGKGVRMLPLTETIPKVLVKVNGRPFLWYVLQRFREAGITDVGIVVGYLKEKVVEFLQRERITATLIEQPQQLGTGHAVLQARQFCGKEQFLVLGGDNLFSVEDLRAVQQDDEYCYVVGKQEPEWKKYGVLVVEREKVVGGRGKLLRIVEKPQEYVGDLINTGLYKFTPAIWGALERIGLSPRGEYELTDAISLLAVQGGVKVLRMKGEWLDLGNNGDVERIEGILNGTRES